MFLPKKDDERLIHTKDEKAKLKHWIMLIVCVAFYLGFNAIIIYLSYRQEDMSLFNINKHTLNGIMAQGQVIAVILLTLNPMKKSHQAALLLCGMTSVASLTTVLIRGSTDALPGIIVPITSGTISIIISNYSKRLKSQLKRVLEYSRIVKRNEEMLHSLAYYDSLTGLPNKKTLMDQIEMLPQKADCFYYAYLDVDNLKKVHDTLGRSICDAVLQNVSQRWKLYCKNEDLIARVGFSEFVVLVCCEMDIVHLRGYLRGFCELLEEPVCIGRKRFHMTVRIGVAKYPDNGGSAEELQRNADIALINAKKPGNNVCQFFCKVLLDNVERKTRLENDLMSAISNNELFVLYQPQYSCGSSRLRGFEALIRWEHPKLGVISPIEFIPIAEEAGMINDIGKWIIETVLGTFRKLRDIAKVSTIVSIDISVTQMLEPSFISMVSETLKKTGFESRYLEFEMAESALDSKSEYVIRVMKQLKGLDIGLALDDFGATHASLNYLQMLPINILKIGKTLVDKIAPSHQLTGAIISLSHMLGFEVVAQGVELQQQMDDLIEQRCDYIQGDLLSKPIDEGQIVRIYSERGHTS